MIRRACDVLGCTESTSEDRPGVQWVRLTVVTHYDGTTAVWRSIDACSVAHAGELLDEHGEALVI